MRRTVLFAVALFTLLLGTMLWVFHRLVLDSIGETPTIEAFVPSLDYRDSLTPLRIGVFIGVDGVSLSATGKKFSPYEAYKDRETVVAMSPAELTDVAQELRSAGLFEEAEFNAPAFISLPQSYSIMFAWPDEERQFTWISRDECSVPEKYLRIFEKLNKNLKLSLIRDFIAHNRRQIPSEAQPDKPLQLTRCHGAH
jgi:hypothetical protein